MAGVKERLVRVAVDRGSGAGKLVAELAAGGARDPDIGVQITPAIPSASDRTLGIRRYEVAVDGWLFHVSAEPADRARLRDRASRSALKGSVQARQPVRAPIPGRVVRLWVETGQTVAAGERLLAVEAMKMENEVRSPRQGVVESIGVEVGQTVESGDELVVVSEAATEA